MRNGNELVWHIIGVRGDLKVKSDKTECGDCVSRTIYGAIA